MRRKISLLIVLMLVLSTFTNVSAIEEAVEGEKVLQAAEAAETEETVEIEPLLLSLEDAVRIARENSREMWKIDDGIAQVKDARKDAKTAKQAAEYIMSLPLYKN